MRKKLVYTFVFIVSIIAQTSILPVISKVGIAGDAVAMAVLAFSILDGFSAFLGWAIFAGIMYDLASYSLVGTHVFIFLLIVYFVSFFSRRFSVERKIVGLILFFMLVVVSTFLSRGVIALAAAWEVQTLHGYWKTFGNLEFFIFQIICNTIMFSLWFVILKKIKRFFNLEA
jgi:rod shape-determining protein MreD